MTRGPLVLGTTLLAGIALGIAGTLLLSASVERHLPPALARPQVTVEARVLWKQRDERRMLLKLETASQQLMMTTFTSRLPEMDILVEQGDFVTIRLAAGKEPFVDDPALEGVKRGPPAPPAAEGRKAGAKDAP